MEELNSLERRVLAMLTAGDHRVLKALSEQASVAQVSEREHTGVGFVTHLQVPPSVSSLGQDVAFTLADVFTDHPQLERGASFVLFVRRGVIETLEGVTYDERWPSELEQFRLSYFAEPRDLELPSL